MHPVIRFLIIAGFVCCWACSPDSIILLLHLAGNGLGYTAIAIITAYVLALCTANYLYRQPYEFPSEPPQISPEFRIITRLNRTATISAIATLVIFLPTGILVSAGFAFNEIFVHWFPNFGFSYLLLALVTIIHFFPEQFVRLSQILFFILTISSLLIIAISGLISPASQPNVVPDHLSGLTILGIAPLLFLGFDRQSTTTNQHGSTSSLYVILVLLASLFLLLSVAAARHVPAQTLGNSTISHLILARNTLGQPGRMIMGIGIICGSLLVTNGLFWWLRQELHIADGLISILRDTRLNYSNKLLALGPLIPAVIIAILLAAGLAGSENLELLIFGSLLLWLLSVTVRVVVKSIHYRHSNRGHMFWGMLLATIFLLDFLVLLVSHPSFHFLAIFCCVTLTLAFWWVLLLDYIGSQRCCHNIQ